MLHLHSDNRDQSKALKREAEHGLSMQLLLTADRGLDAGVQHREGSGGLPHQCSVVSVGPAQRPKMSARANALYLIYTCCNPCSPFQGSWQKSWLCFTSYLVKSLFTSGKGRVRDQLVSAPEQRAYLCNLLLLEQTRSQQEHSLSTLRIHTSSNKSVYFL